MKVKNQFLVIAILTIFLGILLCSCKTENSEVPEDRYSVFQKGFASSMGNKIVESPDGFYLFYGNFLTFLDKNLKIRSQCVINQNADIWKKLKSM